MSLSTSASLTLGNQRFDAHAAAVWVELATLPGASSARVVLPAAVQVDAQAGDSASLSLDGGEGLEAVLTGKIVRLERRLDATEILLADGARDLAALRPVATYERQNGRAVIRALCADAGVELDALEVDLPLAAFAAHPRRTAAEHVALIAELAGAVASFSGEGSLRVEALSPDRASLALSYGREILDLSATATIPGPERVVVGSGSAGAAEAPDALKLSVTPLPDGARAPGANVVWRAVPLLRTPSAVRASSDFAQLAAGPALAVVARCWLLPKLRAGMVVTARGLPSHLAMGPCVVTRVRHVLHPSSGAVTLLEGRASQGSSRAGSLLSSAASALGGLL